MPAHGCMPWKTPLQQSANNQHKAKIEPGKSFVNSEPRCQVKFHQNQGTNFRISGKFKGSLSSFSPGENTYAEWPSSVFAFSPGKNRLLSVEAQKTGVPVAITRDLPFGLLLNPKKYKSKP
ncbi:MULTISPECIES: hypothetical protein [Variovorax]|uniref:hypothetical protein n=1 Tax=Variovorax atrisoli TaxID=3394203 RepID=UPI0012FD3F82|nr:hypothetical protein [Variovorax paradoxus]